MGEQMGDVFDLFALLRTCSSKLSISRLKLTSASHKPTPLSGLSEKQSKFIPDHQTKIVMNSSNSVFETTIRYVAALLSAYELSGRKYSDLLTKAEELGNKLAFAWDRVSKSINPINSGYQINSTDEYIYYQQSNDIPYNELNFTTNTPQRDIVSRIPGVEM